MKRLLVVLTIIFLAFISCQEEGQETATEAPSPDETLELRDDEALMAPSLEEIIGDPEEFKGSTVTVTGELKAIYNPRAFTVAVEDAGRFFVFSVDPLLAESVEVGNAIQITGVIHQYIRADVEAELGHEVTEEVHGEIQQMEPILVATDVSEAR